MVNALQIKNLSVTLGGKFIAIKDISLDVPTGQITGLIGPSGSGKTTLIRSIVGRQKVSEGTVTVLGQPAGSADLRSKIAYMTQELSVYSDITVRENLRYFATMNNINRTGIEKEVLRVLTDVDMADKTNTLVNNLSGGQKQRVSLAIALLGEPQLLVLDEPTVGLDPILREQLWKLFYALAIKGITIIISSHAMDEANRCHNLVLIRNGKILAHNSPQLLCDEAGSKTVEEAFIRLVRKTA